MNDRDVLQLLIFANELDSRVAPNELRVVAWREVLASQAAGLSVEVACEIVAHHYGNSGDMLTPVVVVRGWRQRARVIAETGLPDGSCGRVGCVCDHVACDRGWLQDGPGEAAVAPCRVCRPNVGLGTGGVRRSLDGPARVHGGDVASIGGRS